MLLSETRVRVEVFISLGRIILPDSDSIVIVPVVSVSGYILTLPEPVFKFIDSEACRGCSNAFSF